MGRGSRGGIPCAEPRALTSSFSSRCRSHSCSYMRFPTPVLSRVEMICSCVSLLSMMLYSSIKHRICRDQEACHRQPGLQAGLLRKGWGAQPSPVPSAPRALCACGGARVGVPCDRRSFSSHPLCDAGELPAPAPPVSWERRQHLANTPCTMQLGLGAGGARETDHTLSPWSDCLMPSPLTGEV